MKKLLGLVAVVALAMQVFADTEMSFGSFAITGSYQSQNDEKDGMKAYLESHDIDCSIYDYAGASYYFIDSDFTTESSASTYHVNWFIHGYRTDKITGALIANNFRYYYARNELELVNCPTNELYKINDNTVGVFHDKYNQEFVIANLRHTYTKASTLSGIPTFLSALREAHPQAIMLVAYNGRTHREVTKTDPVQQQDDFLDDYLVNNDSGPKLTRLGRGSEGGFYTDSASFAKMTGHSVEDAIVDGFSYTGAVARVTIPTKHRIIFTDWDDSVIQTNIVNEGESVTPPTPMRPGFSFAGWEGHPAAHFEAVMSDFVAKAVYTTSGNVVTFIDWDSTPIAEVAVSVGAAVAEPTRPVRLDHTFKGWKDADGNYWNFADVVASSMTLTANYELDPELKIGSADEFLRMMAAGYPATEVYTITNDIDFTGKTITAVDFGGTIKGCGHSFTGVSGAVCFFENLSGTVKDLTIVCDDELIGVPNSFGVLAATLSGAHIENCTISDSHRKLQKTNGYIGVFASLAETNSLGEATVFTNCTVRNSSVISTGSYINPFFGGFVARASAAKFYNCRFITDDKDNVAIGGSTACYSGGLVAVCAFPGMVEAHGCYVEGVIEMSSGSNYTSGIGGIFGVCDGSNTTRPDYLVSCSTNRATLVGKSNARFGGIVGIATKTNIRIEGCVNEGAFVPNGSNESLNDYHGIGGIIGAFWSNGGVRLEVADSVNYSDIIVTTNVIPVGGIVGRVNITDGVMITNSFNYGDIESDVAAGGIIGRIESTASIDIFDVGNVGSVTSVDGPAGGVVGYWQRSNNSGDAPFVGIMQNGAITTGTNCAGNIVGYIGGRFYQCENVISNAVLAGSVTAIDEKGQVGQIAGKVLADANAPHEATWTVSNVYVTNHDLVPYYTLENEPVTDVVGILEMTAAQLKSKTSVGWLNAGRSVCPWILAANCPELSIFAEGVIPEPKRGMMIFFW